MDIIFYIGICFLPFENFFFAPSSGWAAITPIIFLLYVIANWKLAITCLAKYRFLIGLFWIGLIIFFVNLLFIETYWVQAIYRMINTSISYILGMIILMSLNIYCIQKKANMKKIEKLVIAAYSIAFFVGLCEYVAIKMNISDFKILYDILSKRSYIEFNRVQYCFTEPSFIGMHIYGVLLPIYVYGKNKKIRNLIVLYAVCSILFGCGIRIILDTIIVILIIFLSSINLKRLRTIILLIGIGGVFLAGAGYLYQNNSRIANIVNEGVYADGSLASRWFRINASLIGYKQDILHALVGYGLGNEIIPIKQGFTEAYKQYNNSYMAEVNYLNNAEQYNNESTSFCLYIRIISEFGIIIFLLLIWKLLHFFKKIEQKEWKTLFLILVYLYLQFEPYAFYSIWLFIVLYERQRLDKNENYVELE